MSIANRIKQNYLYCVVKFKIYSSVLFLEMKPTKMKKIISITCCLLTLISCDNYSVMPDTGSIQFNINYKADETPLQFDTIRYTNQAGNVYSVTRLEYYLSNITFHKADGSAFTSGNTYYINARNKSSNQFILDSIPPGNYTAISFYLGLDSVTNKTGSLSNTVENINMAWPDMMGGGYHFMKMEGYFLDTTSTSGYAIHLGRNNNLVKIRINQSFAVKYKNQTLNLVMNINEWYKNPATYNFNVDGNYSMSNMQAMMKLKMNGADVFTVE